MQEQYDSAHEQSLQPPNDRSLSDKVGQNDVSQSAMSGATSTTSNQPTGGEGAGRRVGSTARDAQEQMGPAERAANTQPDSLLPTTMARSFEARWEALQTAFVDEPHRVVEQADALVAEVMQRIIDILAQERKSLESQWASDSQVSTEDLRLTLKHYRSLFQHLISA